MAETGLKDCKHANHAWCCVLVLLQPYLAGHESNNTVNIDGETHIFNRG